MKTAKGLATLLLTALLLCCSGVSAYAHDVPDLDRTGTINISMHSGESAVPGGSLTIYRVGEIREDDGNYRFVPEERFRDWGDSLWDRDFFEKEDTARMAKSMEEYVRERGITGTVREIGADGTISCERAYGGKWRLYL